MRNLYPGKCFVCGKEVKEKEGHFQAVGGMNKAQKQHWKGIKWLVRCTRCVGRPTPINEDNLK